jgi:tetratricopeptide (TPR) repeat protein
MSFNIFHTLKRTFGIAMLLVLVALKVQAGIIDKAFEALEMKDYFKAKQLFHKAMDKDRIAANFGLCRVHLEQQNPFFNLDSARAYALRTESLYKTAEQKERDRVLDHGITEASVNQLRKTMYALALSEVTAAKSIEACDRFIVRFPSSPDKKIVLDMKASLAFEKAKADGSLAALKEFITHNPTSPDVVEAKVLYERALYDAATKDGSVASYRNFIAAHPDSPHRRTAEDKVYALSTASGTLEAYHQFIRTDPKNVHVRAAWRQVFKLFTSDFRAETLTNSNRSIRIIRSWMNWRPKWTFST